MSIELLIPKLKKIRDIGFVPVTGRGSGRFGLTLEALLGLPKNSSKSPDYFGVEIKTKRGNGLQTLFSRTPSSFLDNKDRRGLVTSHGYTDKKKNRTALYTSFSSEGDSLGFSLAVSQSDLMVIRHGTPILRYDHQTIREALLSKHNETVYLTVITKKGEKEKEFCRFDKIVYCKFPSYKKFKSLVTSGKIYLDFTLSISSTGKVKDHGFLWRIYSENLTDLYETTEEV